MLTLASSYHEGIQQQYQKSEFETQLKWTKMNCEVVYFTYFVK